MDWFTAGIFQTGDFEAVNNFLFLEKVFSLVYVDKHL